MIVGEAKRANLLGVAVIAATVLCGYVNQALAVSHVAANVRFVKFNPFNLDFVGSTATRLTPLSNQVDIALVNDADLGEVFGAFNLGQFDSPLDLTSPFRIVLAPLTYPGTASDFFTAASVLGAIDNPAPWDRFTSVPNEIIDTDHIVGIGFQQIQWILIVEPAIPEPITMVFGLFSLAVLVSATRRRRRNGDILLFYKCRRSPAWAQG